MIFIVLFSNEGTAVSNPVSANSLENGNSSHPKIEKEVDAVIEIVESDGEDVVWAANDTINNPVESDLLQEPKDMSIYPVLNTDFNNDKVNIKDEFKVEEVPDKDLLTMVEFNPNQDVGNGAAVGESSLDRSQPSTSSVVQEQSKRKGNKRFNCESCEYGSDKHDHFREHLKIHDGVKPFKCDCCGHAFRRRGNLIRHFKIHVRQKDMGITPDSKDGLYKCKLCVQSFMNANSLYIHMRKLHKNNQRFFNCVHCLLRFPRRIQKVRHETKCQRRRYECYLCKQVTACAGKARQHMCRHSGAKLFVCEICNMKFRFDSGLRRHLNSIHSLANV